MYFNFIEPWGGVGDEDGDSGMENRNREQGRGNPGGKYSLVVWIRKLEVAVGEEWTGMGTGRRGNGVLPR